MDEGQRLLCESQTEKLKEENGDRGMCILRHNSNGLINKSHLRGYMET